MSLVVTLSAQDFAWQYAQGPFNNEVGQVLQRPSGQVLTVGGVLRTTFDEGRTWTPMPTPFDSLRYLAADSALLAAVTRTGLWVSADEGVTWQERTAPPFAAEPSAQGRVQFCGAQRLVVQDRQGFLWSDDQGRSWTAVSPSSLSPPPGYTGDFQSFVLPDCQLLIYYEQVLNQLMLQVVFFRSTDDGRSFVPVTLDSKTVIYSSPQQVIETRTGKLLMVTKGKTYRSSDRGTTWQTVQTGLAYEHHLVKAVLGQQGILYETAKWENWFPTGLQYEPGPMYRANDDGEQARLLVEVRQPFAYFQPHVEMQDGSFLVSQSPYIYCMLDPPCFYVQRPAGLLRFKEGVTTQVGTTPAAVWALAFHRGALWVGTGGPRRQVSDEHWERIGALGTLVDRFAGADREVEGWQVPPLTAAPVVQLDRVGEDRLGVLTASLEWDESFETQGLHFYVGWDGVSAYIPLSTEELLVAAPGTGVGWFNHRPGLFSPQGNLEGPKHAQALYASSHGIYAGFDQRPDAVEPQGILLRTRDQGATWEAADAGLTVSSVYRIGQSGDGILYVGTPDGLFQTFDGTTWQRVGLEGRAVWALIPDVDGVGLLVGTDRGVYRRATGETWEPVGTGLEARTVYSLLIVRDPAWNAGAPVLVAGTDAGVYTNIPVTRVNSETPVQPITQGPEVFPNPANASVTVRFPPSAGPVQARVHDVLGRVVATLYDGRGEAIPAELHWNTAGLAAGVYVVRLSREGQGPVTARVALTR